MKKLVLLLLGISQMVFAHNEQELIELYRTFNQAKVQADIQQLEQMLSPNFTLTHMTGYLQSREEWLNQVENGQMRYFKTEEVSVEPLLQGNTGKIIGRAYTTANIWGIQGTWNLQLIFDLQYQNGKWVIEKAVASTF